MPAAVSAYAGLRWVPADATYVVASRRVEDVVLVARELIDAIGILSDNDVAQMSADSSRDLGGLDLFSTASLTDHGIDVGRGAVVFASGLSPTIALPLSDPQRFAAYIEQRRGGGAVVQVSRAHDLDVYTFRPDRDEAVHWTFAGDWFLAHYESFDEREPEGAWLDVALAARGGFGAEADLTAAIAEGTRRLGAEPPVLAVARLPRLMANKLVTEPAACAETIGRLGRLMAVAGVTGGEVRGAIVADVTGGTDGVRALRTPIPAGWQAARAEAPIQAEVGIDLRAIAQRLSPCVEDDLVEEFDLNVVRAARAFIYRLDPARFEGRAAVAVELVEPGYLEQMLDQIPGLSFMRKSRKVGTVQVHDVDVPMMAKFSYAVVGSTSIAGLGGTLDAVVAGGMGQPGDELGRVRLRPQALSADEWVQLLEPVVGRDRARDRIVRRLRRWKLGEVTLAIDGAALVLAAHGQR